MVLTSDGTVEEMFTTLTGLTKKKTYTIDSVQRLGHCTEGSLNYDVSLLIRVNIYSQFAPIFS
jgi:hypothetical protein